MKIHRKARAASTLLLLSCLLSVGLVERAAATGSATLTNVGEGGQRPYLEYRVDEAGGVQRQTILKAYVNPGETLSLGSSAVGLRPPGAPAANRGGRIFVEPPQGAAIECPTTANIGRILNRAQEVAGPLPNAGGYTPCVITVGQGQGGVWNIHFVSPNIDNQQNPPVLGIDQEWSVQQPGGGAHPGGGPQPNNVGYVTAWDVTVRNPNAPPPVPPQEDPQVRIPGRLFANYLALNMGDNTIFDAAGNPTRPVGLYGNFQIQTRDGYRYVIDLNGIDPFGFIFFANNKGFRDNRAGPNNGAAIYRSVQLYDPNPGKLRATLFDVQKPSDPDTDADVTHKIFFETPAADLPEESPARGANNTPVTTWLLRDPQLPPDPQDFVFRGIEGTPDQAGTGLGGTFSFTAVRLGSYEINIDINGNGIFGDGNDRVLVGTASIGLNTAVWDGNDKQGVPAPASTIGYDARLNFNAGEVHFPFLDPENNPFGLIITRTAPLRQPNESPTATTTIYYNDSYSYTGRNVYDYSLCSASDAANPPPAGAGIAVPACYGEPPIPINGSSGVDSAVDNRTADGYAGPGARNFSLNGGDRRGMDTWVYVKSPAKALGNRIVVKEADLVLEKSHVEQQPRPGGPITYKLVVRNNGPSDVSAATVTDTLPPTVVVSSWSCAITSGTGSCGQAQGTGNVINTTVDLASGASATYTINGVLAANVAGCVDNTAVVGRPPDVNDPVPANNQDTDQACGTTALLLNSFAVQRSGEVAEARWQTALELNTLGFHVWRSATTRRADAVRLTLRLMPARGSGSSYTFRDLAVPGSGQQAYWIEEIQNDGTSQEYGPALLRRAGSPEGNTLFLPLLGR